jgi:hypothetical protein
MRSIGVAVVVLAGLGLGSVEAHAAGGIVLESYTGARPADASKIVGPVLGELATRGFGDAGAVIATRFEAQVSRAAVTPDGLPKDFADQIEKGHRAWIAGSFDDAVAILGPIVDAVHANPGALARNAGARDRVLKALIALALSQHRRGDPSAARTTLGELLRSYPDAQVQKGVYGPEAASLFEQVKKELAAGPRGRLLVKLADEQAEVFINERLERRGTTVKELVPGEYRIMIALGDQMSRSHRVVIEAGKEQTLTIDLAFDAVVRTSPAWSGFEFASASDRESAEAGYAAQFANAVGGGGVVVVGIDQVRGRPAIVGSLVSLVNGREIRRASVALDSAPAVERMRSLARFLAGEQATADIDVQIAGDPAVVQAVQAVKSGELRATSSSPRWGGWPFLTGIGALAGLGVGGALLYYDGKCKDGSSDPNCPDVYNNAAAGWAATGAGVVLATITVYLIVTRPKSAPSSTAFVVPAQGGALAGFATTF